MTCYLATPMQDQTGRVAEEDECYFELHVRPSIKILSTIRRFVSEFYERVLNDADVSSRLAVATHELLENAIKYATTPETTLRIEYVPETAIVVIRLWNDTSPAHIAKLRDLLDRMAAASSPSMFYEALLRGDLPSPSNGGVGLARIYADAGMTLRCEVEDDRLCILAEAKLDLARSGERRASRSPI